MIGEEKIRQILTRYEFLEAKMAAGLEPGEYAAVSREYAQLEPVVLAARRYRQVAADLEAATTMLADPEMRALAEEEIETANAALPEAEQALKLALIPKDAADQRAAILEIRPGTGGDEAALFAGDLFAMYNRYAALRKAGRSRCWTRAPARSAASKKSSPMSAGDGVFARLKYESGVHRVQRVPETEIRRAASTPRRRQSRCCLKPKDIDVEISDQEDIRIDTMRASGAGGQHVNTTDSAVRITHLPTGLVVTSSEKSQHQNRARAMQVLRARLFDAKRREHDEARAAERKGQVGSGDRSERIRTYNFPQGRVTDHRINLTLFKLEAVMNGDLHELIDALQAADQAAKLAEMEAA